MLRYIAFGLCLSILGCSNSAPETAGRSGCVSVSFEDAAPQPLCYREVDGRSVYQGDIVLGNESAAKTRGLTSGGAYLQAHTWPSGIVPYTIDPGLPNAARVTDAINRYHARTKLRFLPRTTQRDFVTFRRNAAGACFATLGRAGGQQFIDLGDACSMPNTIHEIGHAIGLWHEQARSDRDAYVNILWGNILAGQESNFSQDLQNSRDFGPYDFHSIMHYFPTAFSKNGQPTITRKSGAVDFGSASDLSGGDVTAIAALYGGVVNPGGGGWLNGVEHAIAGSPMKGGAPISVWNAANGQLVATVQAFPGFGGAISVALGDINGDGVLDIIAAAGPGAGPHVVAWSGTNGQMIRSFFAHDGTFRGGLNVASADVNHDGADDIITGVASIGGPHVKVFDGRSNAVIGSFYAYGAGFLGGVRVAGGDTDGDGYAEIITGAGPGAGTDVRVYALRTGAPTLSAAFFAYDSGFKGGILVGAGDIDNDGRADVITGAGPGAGPHVVGRRSFDLTPLASFHAFSPQFAGGVNVSATTFGGQPALIAGPGAANGQVCAFNTAGGMLWCGTLGPAAVGAFVTAR